MKIVVLRSVIFIFILAVSHPYDHEWNNVSDSGLFDYPQIELDQTADIRVVFLGFASEYIDENEFKSNAKENVAQFASPNTITWNLKVSIAFHDFLRAHVCMTLEGLLESWNVIINRNLLPWDIKAGRHFMHFGGIRLGTREVTRLGMREGEMVEVAEFMMRIVIDKEDVEKVRRDVAEFRMDFQRVRYCFEDATEAYKYVKIR